MARIRSIKPELPHDPTLARASIPARLTFILLITVSDDHGYVRGEPRTLLGQLYPHDTAEQVLTAPNNGRHAVTAADIAVWIGELVALGIVRRHELRDGAIVLQIAKWAKHQRIDNAGRSFLAERVAENRRRSRKPAAKTGESPLGVLSLGVSESRSLESGKSKSKSVAQNATVSG